MTFSAQMRFILAVACTVAFTYLPERGELLREGLQSTVGPYHLIKSITATDRCHVVTAAMLEVSYII
jgi:hypothetical protein